MAVHKITLSASGWTQETPALWWDTISQLLYADSDLTQEATRIVPPTRECWQFNGFFSASSGGVQYIDTEGNFTNEFVEKAMTLTAALTINVQQTRVSWKLTLDPNGGTTALAALYYRVDGGGYYTTDLCADEPVTSVPRAVKEGNAFRGYFNGTTTPGTQYVDKDGGFLAALSSLVLTADKAIHAAYLAPYKVTVSANSGAGGDASFYYDSVNGLFYATADVSASPITRITMHTRETYKGLGYWSTNATTGVMRVSPDGTIAADFAPTDAVTIHAQWKLVSYKVTIGKQSGTGGTDALYYSQGVDAPAGWYYDDLCTQAANTIAFPTRAGYTQKGVYSAQSGGTEYITRHGEFLAAFNTWGAGITAAKTVYVQWVAVYKITLNPQSGEGGTAEMWYSSLDDKFYTDNTLDTEVTSVVPPTRECWQFTGFYSANSGGTQYVTHAGDFTQALLDLSITAAKTFYAQWVRVSWKLTLDPNGGTLGDTAAIYNDGVTAVYYADDQCTTPVTSVSMPSRAGYAQMGMYASKTGGSKYIDDDGRILLSLVLTASATVYARWSPITYTLTFDYNGGQGTVPSKSVTMGEAIGTLPSAAHNQGLLDGWYVGETKLTSSRVWDFPEDAVAVAKWRYYFGNLTDWFGLETANGPLMLVASNPGSTRTVIETSHAGALAIQSGDSSGGAFKTFGILLNPVCTYRIRKEGRVTINLGAAWPGSGATKSGYMLVNAEYSTAADGEPVLVVRGVANEGAPAINRWSVNLDVSPDHIAQDPMNAVTGGGELTECKTLVTCDPVVPMENGMPCASDIVHGKVVVTATTNAYGGENAPTARLPFIETNGVPPDESDVDFTTYAFTAERSL